MSRPAGMGLVGVAAIVAGIAAAALFGSTTRDEGWTIERFDAAIAVLPDASLRIVEAIDVDFGALQKHGIFRDVPLRYRFDRDRDRVYALFVEAVTDASGRALRHADETFGPTAHVRIGDPDRTVTGRQSYRITYRVFGALNPLADHDELFWNVNGGGWPVRARAVTAAVTVASDAITRTTCFQGASGSTEPCRADVAPRRTGFAATRDLPAGQQLTIVVALRSGAVATPPLKLEAHEREFFDLFATDPLSVGGAAAILLGGVGALAWVVWRRGRDVTDATSRGAIVAEYEPPEHLTPAQVGVLVDEIADPKDLTATIVDLAVRGYLAIEDGSANGDASNWRITKRRSEVADLAPYERTLFEALFLGRDSVDLDALRGEFRGPLLIAEGQLYADAVSRGWFAESPEAVRQRWGLFGCGLFLVGLAVAGVAGSLFDLGLAGAALAMLGVPILVASRRMPRRTAAGSEELRHVLGFKLYMDTAETERQRFAERENIFTRYLPYAIVFGSVTKWARAFSDLDVAKAAASWYTGSALSAATFSSGLQGFSSSLSSAIVVTPGGSGSSGFSGGGFSGGFSGGGGGGGGGGSW